MLLRDGFRAVPEGRRVQDVFGLPLPAVAEEPHGTLGDEEEVEGEEESGQGHGQHGVPPVGKVPHDHRDAGVA